MLLIVVAVLGGILVGLALGGSLSTLSEARLRWWPLALIGLALQLVPVSRIHGHSQHDLAVGLLIASYVVLLLFVGLNFRLPGFWLIAVGFALNLLVISVNGGMPVNEHALRVAGGPRYAATIHDLLEHGGAKHHLARPDDVLLPLSDAIPMGWPIRNVFSVGDLMSMAGIAWVLAAATKGPAGRHRVGSVLLRQGSGVALQVGASGAIRAQESSEGSARAVPRSPVSERGHAAFVRVRIVLAER